MDAIIKKEALEATDEEVEEKIKEVVQNTNVKNGDEIDLEK